MFKWLRYLKLQLEYIGRDPYDVKANNELADKIEHYWDT